MDAKIKVVDEQDLRNSLIFLAVIGQYVDWEKFARAYPGATAREAENSLKNTLLMWHKLLKDLKVL